MHRAPFLIFVDTAGVATVGPDTYITWIFAKSTPTSLPSSGILVVFDCGQRLVQRIAHVVYQLDPADSTKVIGPVVGDSGSAVPPTVPGVFELVCKVGREHGYDVPAPAEKPKAPKTSPYSQS